jgi:hypothetical protein
MNSASVPYHAVQDIVFISLKSNEMRVKIQTL